MTREEAQGLIQVLKKIMQTGTIYLPKQGNKSKIDLRSIFSDKDRFIVDINCSSKIRRGRYTLLLRYRKDQGLLRIDVGGPEHVNPDGEIIPCPHVHVQQRDAGKWDAWAASLPALFGATDDRVRTLKDFLEYCNVNNITSIEIAEQATLEGM